jgi:uncharacterized lipoprotein YmbA
MFLEGMLPRGAKLDNLVLVVPNLLVSGLLAGFAGCGSVPTENFYTLSAVAAPQSVATVNANSDFTVVVDEASVPELVDRPQFVVGVGESRVAVLEQQRWAEPLKTQIARTVAMNLARSLDAARVSTTLHAGGRDADIRITLDVQRFDARPGEAVAVEVLWTVRRGAAAVVKTGRSAVREAIGQPGYDALVAAHNRALAIVSRDIAAAIR